VETSSAPIQGPTTIKRIDYVGMAPNRRHCSIHKARRGGRAVEGTGLENRQRREPLVGSNPTPSAIFEIIARTSAGRTALP
jgi:hypothetical protein